MNKKDIIDKALTFGFGGMNTRELQFLADICKDKKVLELGSHIGQSAYVIANVAKELHCVDAWIDNCPYLEESQSNIYSQQPKGMEQQFDTNTKGLNIKKIKGFTSDVVSLVDNNYDIIVIDADHSYEGVKQDIENYKNKGILILFHDYGGAWIGVKKAVDESKLQHITKVDYLLLVKGERND
jgi:predicted O-methyltransferase YrrM